MEGNGLVESLTVLPAGCLLFKIIFMSVYFFPPTQSSAFLNSYTYDGGDDLNGGIPSRTIMWNALCILLAPAFHLKIAAFQGLYSMVFCKKGFHPSIWT